LHWIRTVKVAGPLKIDHFVRGSIAIGRFANRLRGNAPKPARWDAPTPDARNGLVQIKP
jgi:hypothetical protein